MIVSGLAIDAVEAGALELLEPLLRGSQIGGRGGDVDRGAGAGQGVDEGGAALAERPLGVVVIAECEQVERDEGCRRLLGEHPHPRIGRVDALLQRLEIQPVVGGDDDFTVDHAALRQLGLDRGDQFGEVPGHGPLVAAAQLDLVAVAETDRPEAIPLRLVGRFGWDRCHGFGQHR